MDLELLSKEAHQTALEHGFGKNHYSIEHCLMLIITEISEAVEAHRKGKIADMRKADIILKDGSLNITEFEICVKNTLQDEMADIAIRLLSFSGKFGIKFNEIRPCKYVRSFENYQFTENALALVKGLLTTHISIIKRVQFGLHFVQLWAKDMNFNLEKHIKYKMLYNKTRPYKHGKKY